MIRAMGSHFGKATLAAMLSLTPAYALGGAEQPKLPATIQPGTPQAARVLKLLDHAARHDREDSHAFTAEDSDAGMYYYEKAKEAAALADDLRRGRAVRAQDVKRALDNSGAIRFKN
jgi:hypothetical protein